MGSESSSQTRVNRVSVAFSWLIFILLLPIMLLSLSIVIQAVRLPDQLPIIFGYKALILMPSGNSSNRALGLIKTIEPTALAVDDWVAYRENNAFYVEQIAEIKAVENGYSMRTKSAANEQIKQTLVAKGQMEGLLIQRIPRVGSLALFLQTPIGMLLCFFLPCLLLLLPTTNLRRRKQTA